MSDENERSVASAGSVADIIDRLLAAVKADSPIQRALVVSAAAEIERLRFAIRRLADQDATLSVCDGNVTVDMDATLTDAERVAVNWAIATLETDATADAGQNAEAAATLCGLLGRLGNHDGREQERVVRLPPLDPNGAPGWNAAIGAVREALADAGVDWDTE